MATLKKNSETIEFLNVSLTEAQKFSFRALLSSKQNQHTQNQSVAAPTYEQRQIFNSTASIMSRQKSPYERRPES